MNVNAKQRVFKASHTHTHTHAHMLQPEQKRQIKIEYANSVFGGVLSSGAHSCRCWIIFARNSPSFYSSKTFTSNLATSWWKTRKKQTSTNSSGSNTKSSMYCTCAYFRIQLARMFVSDVRMLGSICCIVCSRWKTYALAFWHLELTWSNHHWAECEAGNKYNIFRPRFSHSND